MDNFAPAYHELTIHWPQNTVISFFSSLRCLNNFLKASTKSMPLKLSSSSEDDESLKLNNRLFRPMKFIVQHEMT
ncbi:hypothetical protein T06_6770 [Trichinella sp. T6]|nr:hypothetical protein T06_6770 [Trichinella sp. T6]